MKQNVYLFQPQYSVEIRDEKNYWLPYSVACLWSYASQFEWVTENFILQEIVFLREPVENVLTRIVEPSICGFSCYIWNAEYCLALAKEIKIKWPNCKIVFGGAQPTKDYLDYDFIDILVESEGEISFVEILKNHIEQTDLITIPKKLFEKNRLTDLDIPSPYTTGLFDKLVQNNPDVVWAATLETNRGCPFACTFCAWGTLTYSKVKKFDTARIEKELEWMSENNVIFIMTGDANFGIFKQRDIEIANLIMKYAHKSGSRFETLHMNYTKNGTDAIFEIGKTLQPLMREGITISVQSMHKPTLQVIKRDNLEINKLSRLLKQSEDYNIPTYTEMIIGLPLETLHSWKEGMCEVLEIGQHSNIDVWWAQMLNNTEMNTKEYKQKYGITSIIAEDYLTFRQSKEDFGYPEMIEIVTSTNTMSQQEMVEGYLYSWMILHFHITGYSQVVARHLRAEFDIPYKTYYDVLFDSIDEYPLLREHYNTLHSGLMSYLSTGKTVQLEIKGHALHSLSYEFFYENRDLINQIAINGAKKCGVNLSHDVIAIQKKFIYEKNDVYPQKLISKLDFFTYQLDSPIEYELDNQIPQGQKFHFQMFRKRGWLKTKFTKSTRQLSK